MAQLALSWLVCALSEAKGMIKFMKDFINSIELYPEKMDNGSIVKQINFKFGVYYEGQETMDIRLLNEKTVEACVLLFTEGMFGY